MKPSKNHLVLIFFLLLIQTLQINPSFAQGETECCCNGIECIYPNYPDCMADGGTVISCNASCYPNWCAILPVELVGFWANPINNNQQIQLKWVTGSESDNSNFTVEKSIDGGKFQIVTIIQGAGSIGQSITYSCIDSFATKGISYYRLSQTDFDGRYRHLKIVSVFLQNNEFQLLSSNPILPNGIVDVFFESMDEKMAILIVYDLNGTKKYEKKFQVIKGGNSIQVDMSSYPSGVYLLFLREPSGNFLMTKG